MDRMRATVNFLSLVKLVKCDGKIPQVFPITCEVKFVSLLPGSWLVSVI